MFFPLHVDFRLYSGSVPLAIEAEPEEETEPSEKAMVEKSLQKTEIPDNEDHPDSALTTTPLRLCRFDMQTFFLLMANDNFFF